MAPGQGTDREIVSFSKRAAATTPVEAALFLYYHHPSSTRSRMSPQPPTRQTCGSSLSPKLLGSLLLLWTPICTSAETTPLPAPKAAFRDSPHLYWSNSHEDPFAQLLKQFPASGLPLQGNDEKSRLQNLLKALNISESSQLLVYSATSLQSGLILPTNPRALYFNENTYVGYVPIGRIEVASIDPKLGPIFYVSKNAPEHSIAFARSERCMNCHAGRTSWQLPGMVAESVIATQSGASLDGFRREIVGHQIPIAERLGGWHVTGAGQSSPHLGNLMGEATPEGYRKFPNPPGTRFDWSRYPNQNSDLFTHLIHEHQLGFHNLVTLAAYRTREVLEAGHGQVREIDQAPLAEIAHRLLRYVLFADEASLPEKGIQPEPVYLQDFLNRAIRTKAGISLRDVDLNTRLFRYRCSYMLLTDSFRALPAPFKNTFRRQLEGALSTKTPSSEFAYLPNEEKNTIRSILEETQALK